MIRERHQAVAEMDRSANSPGLVAGKLIINLALMSTRVKRENISSLMSISWYVQPVIACPPQRFILFHGAGRKGQIFVFENSA